MPSKFLFSQFQKQLIGSLGLDGDEVEILPLQLFLAETFGSEGGTQIFEEITSDISFFRSQDPASALYSDAEILSVRRGVAAIAAHRIFSAILKVFPESLYSVEVMAKYIQKDTNIEIHPTAKIKVPFAIDHGHGTVIGATAEVGEEVFLYHGVTLGASGKRDEAERRHPILGNRVFCGNASQILGPSVIEDGVSLASGSIVVNSYVEEGVKIFLSVRVSGVIIPAGTTVYAGDPENIRRYWVLLKNQTQPAWHIFEPFVSHKGVSIKTPEK
ncbi:MAG: hypothetical protein WCJ84_06695 [Candidatus Peregrinibacteria bacterium]